MKQAMKLTWLFLLFSSLRYIVANEQDEEWENIAVVDIETVSSNTTTSPSEECIITEACQVETPQWLGDGVCDDEEYYDDYDVTQYVGYNTEECCWDGGDCIQAPSISPSPTETPPCQVNELLCTVPTLEWLGDGWCDAVAPYNTEECCYDKGDCVEFNEKYPDCNVPNGWYIGDGYCSAGDYNSEECGFDGGDCLAFNQLYPNCNVQNPYEIGNGYCNGGEYDTEECGFDGGDCIELTIAPTRSPSPTISFSPTVISEHPSTSPTTMLDDSPEKAKNYQDLYIACVDSRERNNLGWVSPLGVHNLVTSFENAQQICQGYKYMSFECPRPKGEDSPFGTEVFCFNERGLRSAKKYPAGECRNEYASNLSVDHCIGPYYHEVDRVWLGGFHRGAVYAVEKDTIQESYDQCQNIDQDNWDIDGDTCPWFQEGDPEVNCLDPKRYQQKCGNAAYHICSKCIELMSDHIVTSNMSSNATEFYTNVGPNTPTSAHAPILDPATIVISGNGKRALIAEFGQKESGRATLLEIQPNSTLIPKWRVHGKYYDSFFGTAVAISGDGKRFAVGGNEVLRVYEENEFGNLVQLGRDIAIEEYLSVVNISFSKDGKNIAFGAIKSHIDIETFNTNSLGWDTVNYVAVYTWDDSKWKESFQSNKSIPKTVSMDDSGKRIIVSFWYLGHGSDGSVQISTLFENKGSTKWEEIASFRGSYGKISGSGERVIVSFTSPNGSVEAVVYEENVVGNSWSKVANSVSGSNVDFHGTSINRTGNRITVKGFSDNEDHQDEILKVFEEANGEWKLITSISDFYGQGAKEHTIDSDGVNLMRLVERNETYRVDVTNLWRIACPNQEFDSACDDGHEHLFSMVNSCSSSCSICSAGTFLNDGICTKCPLGSYQSNEGSLECIPCPEGLWTYSTGSSSLDFCRSECPYPFQSRVFRAEDCNLCIEGFYSLQTLESDDYKTKDTDELCLKCPDNTTCPMGTSVQSMSIDEGFWRESNNTAVVYKCDENWNLCGDNSTSLNRSSNYCKAGHSGPLCESCSALGDYFDSSSGECKKCEVKNLFASLAIFLAGIFIILILLRTNKERIDKAVSFCSNVNMHVKLKILVGFYQILNSFRDIYGVEVDNKVARALNVTKVFSMDLFKLFPFPLECAPFPSEYVISGIWPFLLCGAILLTLSIVRFICPDGNRQLIGRIEKCDVVNLGVVVFYFALPVVTQDLFDAKKCRSFITQDINCGGENQPSCSTSYLLFSKDIVCGSEGPYETLQALFWAYFTLWPIAIFGAFGILLRRVKPSIMMQKPSDLALNCRFLWADYNDESDIAMYWDLIDFIRKLGLVGFINFIQEQEGSTKMLRLTIATVASVIYSMTLALVRPYKRSDDFKLAVVSSILLSASFCLGFSLKMCTTDESCSAFMGFENKMVASMLVGILAFSMLVIMVFVLMKSSSSSKVVTMKYGRHPPNLELPQVCDHHLFMSHFWHTGQDKCHAIARKLQLFMPALKIWLDVDNLDDVEKLEHYVEKSAVVLIFYSDGYFGSKNCRREFLHALKKDKPLIVVYDGPNEIIEKCQEFCSKEALAKDGYSDSDVNYLQNRIEDFAKKHDDPNESIQWLKVSAFSAESLKLIYMKLLLNLPRSEMDKNYRDSLIEYGLQLPKEISLLSKIEYELNILVCHKNAYAVELAEEIKANSPKVNVLKETTEEWNSTEDMETIASSVQTEEIQESVLDSYMHSFSEFFWGKSKPVTDENQTSVALGNESPKKGVSINDSPTEIYETKIPTVFLLHLNKDTFNEENRESMIASIKIAQRRQDVKIILVHEQDTLKNAAIEFGYFFEETPQTLDPSKFYREIAVPLYTRKEYRKVSLHFIIQKANSYFIQKASTSNKNQSMMVSLRRQSIMTQTSGYTALK